MKIVITDSGFGGLGIAAGLYESLKLKNISDSIEIIFVNGLPDEKYGYNSISDPLLKSQMFNNLLENTEYKLKPDIFVIACNTLSVLLDKTVVYTNIKNKIIDIIEFGTDSVIHQYGSVSNVLLAVIGTQTTIDSNIHRKYFQKYPKFFNTVINFPLTELVTAIENDSESDTTKSIIRRCISGIETEFTHGNYSRLFLILACTHFPYVEHIFRHYLDKSGIPHTLFNPNHYLLQHLESSISKKYSQSFSKKGQIKISVISKTIVTDQKILSISSLIRNISEDTVTALKSYKRIENFF